MALTRTISSMINILIRLINLNYSYTLLGSCISPTYSIAIFEAISQNYLLTAKRDSGWDGVGNNPNPSQQLLLCRISISSLLRIADKKCYNSKSNRRDSRGGTGCWACGSDFCEVSSQRVSARCRVSRGSGERVWESVLSGRARKWEAPLASASNGLDAG